ncbi:2-hydroxymuconate tautomerase [Sneathiella aquimaris]|uniref:2-hydroxymuconate tautomerase n=1 Tax=Sneathiella aquimaris TaxID=2599305 RepID=UPI001469B623|nr:2-hydroxymuconate tautomerase [Sneathiella aquimaris]
MPMIRVEMFAGRSAEQKKTLIKSLTKATSEAIGVSEASVDVVITEVAKENWGLGGEPASEKFPD